MSKNLLSTDPDLQMNPTSWNDYCMRFVGDAFTGNFDRHIGNWGYLVSKTDPDEPPAPAPIYDNGSALFPSLSSKAMKEEVLSDRKEIMKRTLLFPKAAMAIDENKITYLDMLSSNFDPEMTQAVQRITINPPMVD